MYPMPVTKINNTEMAKINPFCDVDNTTFEQYKLAFDGRNIT